MRQTEKDRWMKGIVRYCIGFSSVLIVAGILLAIIGYDVYELVCLGVGLFGGELLMSMVIKLVGGKEDQTAARKPAGRNTENG